jgi:DNA-binding Lrp family transcriptional regulator
LDELDRRLLNIIQTEFPIDPRPFRALGERLGTSESEALARVGALAQAGVIRKIGPSFDTSRLRHVSTLVAARVPAERLEEVAEIVSSFPEVTHNYGRDHEYNLWFTLVARDGDAIRRTLDLIEQKTGISDMHSLPAERMFKIRVNFEF